jgi:uncharacterized protein (TIGR02679 family)
VTDQATDYLGEPALARLWQMAHAAWCRHGEVRGHAIVGELSETEALAISGLIGRARPWSPGDTAHVPLVRIDDRLRSAQLANGLEDVLIARVGPLRSLPRERLVARRQREHGWSQAAAHPVVVHRTELSAWLDGLQSSGQLTRVANRTGQPPFELLQRVLAALALLPCEPPEGLPSFAARATGHTHNLDRNCPIDVLLVSALAHLDGTDRPRDAEGRRALYDRFGVVCDALSNTVLCGGLAPRGDTVVARKLRLSAQEAAPCVLTLSELRDVERLQAGGSVVSICENPEVMATALERLGTRCAPLVCTSGWPRVAALRLLRALSAGGAPLRYHGDFDWHGVRIASAMVARVETTLWRYSASDYRAAEAGPPLDCEPPFQDLPEDLLAVVTAMRARGVSVAEEQVLDELVGDLSSV